MKYYIQRGLNEYGPYTLADLQRYIASGNIQLTDLTRNEAMKEWVPVSQVIGNIPLPPPTPQMPAAYNPTPAAGAGTPSGTVSGSPSATEMAQPAPSTPAAGLQPTPGYNAEGKDIFGGGPAAASSSTGTVYGGPGTSPGGTVYGGPGAAAGGPAYGGTGVGTIPAYGARPQGPMPPDLHWALVLLINFFCNFFEPVWKFIQAAYVKKISPNDNSMIFFAAGYGTVVLAVIVYFGGIISAIRASSGSEPDIPIGLVGFFALLILGGSVLLIIGNFKMRDSLVEHYNRVEPINLRLSGVMTFFFATYYFQYHFSRIAAWKKTGYLTPQ
jgi:uncharacterized protein DUF4339